jgi:hypothetical protein
MEPHDAGWLLYLHHLYRATGGQHMEAHSQNDLHVIENRNRREGIEWGNPK